MATITFTTGEKKQVDSKKALQLYFMQKGLRPTTPEIDKYLEHVERIDFKATRDYTRPAKADIDPGRLPYAD